MRPTWIIQQNTPHAALWLKHLQAQQCNFHTVTLEPAEPLPSLPALNGPVLVQGSTRLIQLSLTAWQPGCFFNPETFRCSRWQQEIPQFLLNAQGRLLSLEDFLRLPASTRPCFLRPEYDLKAFNGGVVNAESFTQLLHSIAVGENSLSLDMPVFMAPLQSLQKEWRVFMCGPEVITGSQYKLKSMIHLQAPLPAAVVEFAQTVARQWTPDLAYVMDIGLTSQDQLKVIEYNCINASAVYAADVSAIITRLEALVNPTA